MEIRHESFLLDVEARLRDWTARIAGLERSLGGERAGKDPRSQSIESLVQKRNTLENKVEKLRQCSRRRWRDVAGEVRRSAEEVEEAWRCVASSLPRDDGHGLHRADMSSLREDA